VLSVAAAGYGSVTHQVTLNGGPLPTLQIRLESRGILEGQVTDIVSGAGLPGATVSLGQSTAMTDKNGHYRLEGVPPGAYALQVNMPGYGAHHVHTTIEPRGSHTLDVTLSPLPGLLRVQVVDADTGQPIEGATVSYGTTAEAAAQAAEPCADYGLLVPLKRSREYHAVRPRVSDLRPTDAWQQDGLHFFVFALHPIDGEATTPTDPPVAVFAMRPDAESPVSAVVVRPLPDGLEPEITPITAAETDSAPAAL
jgi:Carboxypeptidase regulatory-like domain